MLRAIMIAAAIFTLADSPARADWHYVKWGMAKKAAIAASKGEARPVATGDDIVCAFNPQKPFAIIPQKVIAGVTFKVAFCSDGSDAAQSVSLTAQADTNLPTLKRSLVSQYGPPASDGSTTIWNDARSGNTISYYDVGGVVGRIEYKKGGRTGL